MENLEPLKILQSTPSLQVQSTPTHPSPPCFGVAIATSCFLYNNNVSIVFKGKRSGETIEK